MTFKKLTTEDKLAEERQRNLALQAENQELQENIVELLIDLDFRQSMSEMGLN